TGPLESVTAIARGFERLSVLGPLRNDVFVVLGRDISRTRAAGFTGFADLSKTKHADIQLAFAGSALDPLRNALSIDRIFCDSTIETVDAPELGLNMAHTPINSGIAFALGNKRFTASTGDAFARCRRAPMDSELGCYDAPMLPGLSAAWLFGGQLR